MLHERGGCPVEHGGRLVDRARHQQAELVAAKAVHMCVEAGGLLELDAQSYEQGVTGRVAE